MWSVSSISFLNFFPHLRHSTLYFLRKNTKEIEFHYIYVSGINGYYKLRIADLRTAVSNRGIKTGTMEYKLGSPWYAFVILLRMKKAIEDEDYEKWLIS